MESSSPKRQEWPKGLGEGAETRWGSTPANALPGALTLIVECSDQRDRLVRKEHGGS